MIIKGIQARLYPNKSQIEWLNQQFGNIRFTWNYFLSKLKRQYKLLKQYLQVEQIDLPKLNKKQRKQIYKHVPEILRFPRKYSLYNSLVSLKHRNTWLKESDGRSLQVELGYLYQTYMKFFKHECGAPKFKSKKYFKQSYTTSSKGTQIRQLDHSHIKLTKLGKVKAHFNMPALNEDVKQATVTLAPTGDYYVSLTVQCESQALPKTHHVCGIDVGLDDLAILSNGMKFNFKYYANASWRKFRTMLTYKCHWYGKLIEVVNPQYTSQICHTCGMNTGKKPLNIRQFPCPYCHTEQDRDVNASINILRLGLEQAMVNNWTSCDTPLKSVKYCRA